MPKSAVRKMLVLLLMLVVSGVLLLPQSLQAQTSRKRHLLFFMLSAGFKHASIPTGVRVITEIKLEINRAVSIRRPRRTCLCSRGTT